MTKNSTQLRNQRRISGTPCPFPLAIKSDNDGIISLDLPQQFSIPNVASLASSLPALLATLSTLKRSPSQYGTPFQEAVWQAITQIPFGETRTYQEVSRSIGLPQAVRAVANACGANRLALWIPCHRVVRTGGALGGYRWGPEWKRALLAAESSLLPCIELNQELSVSHERARLSLQKRG